MADEITTTGESQASTTADTSATSAPVETAAPAQTTAAAPAQTAPDYAAVMSELGQYKSYFQQMQEAQAAQNKRYEELQNVMMQTFAPEQYRQAQAPKYVTMEQLAQMQQKTMQEAQASATAAMLRTELSSVKEKYPDVFDAYEDDDVLRRWQRTGESLSSICKKLQEKEDAKFQKRQAKLMADKQVVAESTKGSPKGGGVPAPPQKNGRGFSGLLKSLRGAGN